MLFYEKDVWILIMHEEKGPVKYLYLIDVLGLWRVHGDKCRSEFMKYSELKGTVATISTSTCFLITREILQLIHRYP